MQYQVLAGGLRFTRTIKRLAFPMHEHGREASSSNQLRVSTTVLQADGPFMPFSEVPGFTRAWWSEGRPPAGQHWLSFELDGLEIARAQVDPKSDDFEKMGDLVSSGWVVKVCFFEVHENARGRGLGTAAVLAIQERYAGELLIALSVESPGFWAAVGWEEWRDPSAPDVPSYRFFFPNN